MLVVVEWGDGYCRLRLCVLTRSPSENCVSECVLGWVNLAGSSPKLNGLLQLSPLNQQAVVVLWRFIHRVIHLGWGLYNVKQRMN